MAKTEESQGNGGEKNFLLENIVKLGLGKNLPEATPTKCRAFILENGLAFMADMPVDWRYIIWPVYEYEHYRFLVDKGSHYVEETGSIEFIGLGEEDGEDNYFTLWAAKGEGRFYEDAPVITAPYVFLDGTKGEWSYQVYEDYLKYAMGDKRKNYYEGIVRDKQKDGYIGLSMLEEEYNQNERKIVKFLESACFTKGKLGEKKEENILDRELVDLHIWNRYMKLSLQVPKGSVFTREDFKNEEGYETSSYTIYLDDEEKIGIRIESDQGTVIAEPTGDYMYYLDIKDFEETVYNLRENLYYFANYNILVHTWGGKENQELQKYLKGIVQSVKFE
ncbi:MAG: hypothetical protein K2N63_15000 [Lachnospiraceae bacterium]|nr:hypothetical protein [Lachnospiraceae bacterium]